MFRVALAPTSPSKMIVGPVGAFVAQGKFVASCAWLQRVHDMFRLRSGCAPYIGPLTSFVSCLIQFLRRLKSSRSFASSISVHHVFTTTGSTRQLSLRVEDFCDSNVSGFVIFWCSRHEDDEVAIERVRGSALYGVMHWQQ